MSEDTPQRLARLESHVAHLEHLVDQLNTVVLEQGRELKQLQKLVRRQAATLETIELERIQATNPKPPHH